MFDLKEKAKAGALWASVEVATTGVVQFVRIAILARFFISAEEFGLFALASTAVVAISAFSALGTIPYILFRTDADRSAISGVYWLNVASGLVFCALTVLCADTLAAALGDARLVLPLQLLALVLVIDSIGNPLTAIMVRDFQFRPHAWAETSSTLIGTLAALAIAAHGDGIWALVIGTLLQRLVRAAIALWWGLRHRPIAMQATRVELAAFSNFSVYTIAERLAAAANERAPYVFLGWMQDAAQVGIFAVTSNLIATPLQYIMNIALSAFTPVFARMQKEQDKLSSVYFSMLELTMTVISPMFLGLMVTAPLVTPMILGPSWAAAVPTVQWVCISLTVHAIYYFSSALTMGTGKAKAAFALMAMQVPGVLAASLLGAKYGGAEAVAMGQALVSIATIVPYYLFITRRVLGPCLGRFVAAFAIPIAMGAAMASTVALFAKVTSISNPYLDLSSQMAVGAVVYAGMLLAFRPGVVRELLPAAITDRLARRFAPQERWSH